MTSLTLKEQYFNLAIRSLNRIGRTPAGAYVCPICLELFSDTKKLTREHVPPASVGGKMICLTCKECNSRAGHSIDFAMARESAFSNLGSVEGGSHRVKFDFNNHSLNASLKRDQEGIKIEILPKQNNPSTVEAVHDQLGSCNWEEARFQISASGGFKRHTANIAYLKSAYLAAFGKFGYRWIFTPSTNIVRQQIRCPDEILMQNYRIFFKATKTTEFAFYLAEKPIPYLFAVMGDTGVFLPWLETDSNELYSWLESERKTTRSLNCSFIDKCGWPNKMELSLDQEQASVA